MTKHIGHELLDEILSNMGALELIDGNSVELCLTTEFTGQIDVGSRAGVFMFENLRELSDGMKRLVLDAAKEASQED